MSRIDARSPLDATDDLTYVAVVVGETIMRLGSRPEAVTLAEVRSTVAGVLREHGHWLVVADAASGSQRGAGVIVDATQPRVRRGVA